MSDLDDNYDEDYRKLRDLIFYISNSKRYTTRHIAERRIQNTAHSVLHNSINVRNYDIILIYAFI